MVAHLTLVLLRGETALAARLAQGCATEHTLVAHIYHRDAYAEQLLEMLDVFQPVRCETQAAVVACVPEVLATWLAERYHAGPARHPEVIDLGPVPANVVAG